MTDPHSHRAPRARPERWRGRIATALKRRADTAGDRSLGWRVLTPAVFVMAGGLFVASAISSAGTDLRPGRYDDLTDLAQHRSDRVTELNDQRAALQADIDTLSEGLRGSDTDRVLARRDRLKGPAGLVAVKGPGITVTLSDAPKRTLDEDTDSETERSTIVHQQDIQAVANALWAGGAEAITVQGQRIVSTMGIRCVGNSVLLLDQPYSPPYVISGIGDPARMLARIDRDPYLKLYRDDVERYQLGWKVEVADVLKFPAYDGPTEMRYARPIVAKTVEER